MPNTLLSPLQLLDFPGQPFESGLVDSAAARVRAAAGWHIAPVVTETVEVTSYGGSPFLFLPTKRLVNVTAVRGVSPTAFVPADYTVFTSGMLYRSRRWSWPVGVLEVDMVHGYTTCPAELLPLLAALSSTERALAATARDPAVSSVTVGSVSTRYRDDPVGSGSAFVVDDPALDKFILPGAVA